VLLSPFGNSSLQRTIEYNASKLLTTFNVSFVDNNRELALDTTYTTEAGRRSIKSLWETKPFFCDKPEVINNLVRCVDGNYEIRNIPLTLKFEGDSTLQEEGVLIFTPSGKICDLYFGLESHRYRNLISEGNTLVEFRRRQVILDFVENFRTAYNRKDLTYINDVFSDNALIIVGRVIEIGVETRDYLDNNLGKKRVELVRYNKKEYIDHLKTVFQRNEFIKVGFDNIDIFQHPKYKRIYGLTLLQNWTSSSYSDQGYLFLMIDFKDEERPIVHVRTWQPEAYTPEEDVIGLGDFEIIE
jgi:hypothetical protein